MKGLLLLLLLTPISTYADEENFVEISESLYESQKINQDPPLIKIKPVKYPTREVATYCIRPPEIVDTIVFHHSETRNSDTPLRINEYHLDRGTPTDPWYMVAYSYLLTAPYLAASKDPKSEAFFGRPLKFVGAHAGSGIYVPMDENQKRIWESGEVKCGHTNEWVYDPSLVKDGKIKANVTTIGVVIIGNYAPGGPSNPNGSGKLGRTPTANLIDMFARLSCQLQKENPNMKRLAYHDQYHRTSCPGTLKNYMKTIQAKAKGYGCDFQIMSGKY